jgi:hypothetical protein
MLGFPAGSLFVWSLIGLLLVKKRAVSKKKAPPFATAPLPPGHYDR